jgi:septal ring factor EnvC (AmiA/AmiB activator)
VTDFDFDSLLDEVDTPVSKEEVKEVKEEKVENPKINTPESFMEENSKPAPTEEDMSKVFSKKAIKEAKTNSLKPDFSDEFRDMMQEIEKYYKDVFDIKQQIKDLQDELKERRNEAKEIGIKVTAADKAMKEVINQIKESSEDAKYIEDAKRLIEENDSLYNIAVAEAN